ncbi:MAG: hypothetical protein H0V82_02635 [Candidatus Protochlamydia sp.]|nr:hypothetical protein [Candidatus Protochlamydia sp.]
MLFQIDIPKRNGLCAGKGEKLVPGMEYFSLLLSSESYEIIREDYCMECWQERTLPAGFNSRGHWKSKVEAKKIVASSARSDQALHLLREFVLNQQQYEEEIFVLALFLSHAKKLILRKEFKEGETPFALYEMPQSEEFFTIKVLSLTRFETERIQKTLAEKFLASKN